MGVEPSFSRCQGLSQSIILLKMIYMQQIICEAPEGLLSRIPPPRYIWSSIIHAPLDGLFLMWKYLQRLQLHQDRHTFHPGLETAAGVYPPAQCAVRCPDELAVIEETSSCNKAPRRFMEAPACCSSTAGALCSTRTGFSGQTPAADLCARRQSSTWTKTLSCLVKEIRWGRSLPWPSRTKSADNHGKACDRSTPVRH